MLISPRAITRTALVAAVALTVAKVPAFAGVTENIRQPSIDQALDIVKGIDAKAKALGAGFDQTKNPKFQNAQIVVNASSGTLLSRMKKGFLTFYSTGESGGDFELEKRLNVESAISG